MCVYFHMNEDILSIKYQRSLDGVVESFDQLYGRTFATPAASDQCNDLPGVNFEVDAFQYLNVRPCRIMEFDVFEFDGSIEIGLNKTESICYTSNQAITCIHKQSRTVINNVNIISQIRPHMSLICLDLSHLTVITTCQ